MMLILILTNAFFRFVELRGSPDEPKVVLELVKSVPVTSKSQLPAGYKYLPKYLKTDFYTFVLKNIVFFRSNKEEARRRAMSRLKVEIRIRFNGTEVRMRNDMLKVTLII